MAVARQNIQQSVQNTMHIVDAHAFLAEEFAFAQYISVAWCRQIDTVQVGKLEGADKQVTPPCFAVVLTGHKHLV